MAPFVGYLGPAGGQLVSVPWWPLGAPSTRLEAAGAAFAAAGVIQAVRRLPRLRGLMAYASVQLVVYSAIGPPPNHLWHQYIPQLAFDVLLLTGIGGVLEAAAETKWGAAWLQ